MTRGGKRGLLLAAAALAGGLLLLVPPVDAAPQCLINAIGVDTSLAAPDTISTLGLRCGEAGGQVFLAADTLLTSIAVWRHHAETPYGGHLKLWITEVDSAGVPDIGQTVLEGPVISVPFGDGVHPIKMEWDFDPPFVLPHSGLFYFAVQDYCGGHWDLLQNEHNAYPFGCEYRNGINCFTGCGVLRPFPDPFVGFDLIFTIESCRDLPTAVQKKTWGQLKTLYR